MFNSNKKFFTPLIAIIARPFLSWNPSVLTCMSLASSVLFFIGIVTHLYALSIVCCAGFVFDAIDGYVARKMGKTSAFGAFLDSTLDRVSDFFLISSFGFGHLVPWEFVIVVLFTSLFISYLRARAEATFGNQVKAEGFMQRTERLLLLVIGFILFLFYPAVLMWVYGVIFVLNCITIAQRFITVL